MRNQVRSLVRGARRAPASMLLLLLGIVLLLGATVQAVRTARAQQRTVSRVLENYARVAAWNFEQQVMPIFEESVVEPLFHPLHMVSFADGRVAPSSIRVLLDSTQPMCTMCDAARGEARYGVRFLVRGDAVETSVPLSTAAVDTLIAEVRAHRLRTRRPEMLNDGMHAMHVFTLHDTTAAVLYYGKAVPGDTAVYALVFDLSMLTPTFEQVLATRSLLPEPLIEGTTSSELLAHSIQTTDGRLVYGTVVSGPHVGERRLSKLGNLVIRVEILDGAERHLMLGAAPSMRWPFLLGLLAIVTGLLVIAFSQMRREHALAQLRAGFVSSVSHELRTPLALQRIFLDMLKLGRVDTPQRRAWCFDNIDRESTRLAHLVENVLQFSRTERGDMRIAAERAFIAPLIADILAAFEPLAASADARLESQLEYDVTAPVDAGALRQVLMNILENAVKYGPRGQRVVVQLTLTADSAARITVDDQGSGVARAERQAIFQPYRRGAATANSAIAGSGIGLAVVHALVHAHRGRVYVADVPDGGARFVVELPDARREESTDETSHAANAAHADIG